ncbi:hypothetical protein Anas_00172 [Armadillidium nasatum]|uniref:Uncharacterized protein n=1 Tax=Armadillidium nasatum TaxID=96803 RepID=A0A5N5THD9_9CRUS|nr:hypothetical protein Anas_00172 [Armadillidium nasatum]
MEQKFKEFYGYVDQCTNDSLVGKSTKRTFDWRAALSNLGTDDSPIYLPVPIVTSTRNHPYFSLQNTRQKRHAFFNEMKLRNLKNNVIRKLKIASCVLQKMEILDNDLNIQWNEFEKLYTKDYGLEHELQKDLMEVFTKCKNSVLCMDSDVAQKPGDFPLGLKQVMYFKKCEMKKKTAACIKKDLREKPEMFELQGLDGMLDHYEDDDEKMLKTLKLFIKYGDDDAEFFH